MAIEIHRNKGRLTFNFALCIFLAFFFAFEALQPGDGPAWVSISLWAGCVVLALAALVSLEEILQKNDSLLLTQKGIQLPAHKKVRAEIAWTSITKIQWVKEKKYGMITISYEGSEKPIQQPANHTKSGPSGRETIHMDGNKDKNSKGNQYAIDTRKFKMGAEELHELLKAEWNKYKHK